MTLFSSKRKSLFGLDTQFEEEEGDKLIIYSDLEDILPYISIQMHNHFSFKKFKWITNMVLKKFEFKKIYTFKILLNSIGLFVVCQHFKE